MASGPDADCASDVVRLCSDLIQINTSNPSHAERPAAEYVADALADAGVAVEWFEPDPGRASVVARVPGREKALPPLLVHCHLDVVPAVAEHWSVDPFAGVVKDGYVWGRGAVDMKGMVAAILATVRSFGRAGRRPRRDVVLAFFADEEAGGEAGAGYVTAERPDLFTGCDDAIGEVGGFSRTLTPGRRHYFVSTAEKGVLWAKIRAVGQAGHGSMINEDNAVAAICEAVARLVDYEFKDELTPTTGQFLEQAAAALGVPAEPVDAVLDKLGPMSRMVRASLRDTVNPTCLSAGYKVNVVPSSAEAAIDGRFLPGHGEVFRQLLADLAGPRVALEEIFHGAAVESPWDVPLVDAMQRSLRCKDPTAELLPYMGTAFTDAKWLSRLGIRCYGFCPMLLPDDLDFTALFHGVDERVPVAALEFSVGVLEQLLDGF